MFWTTLLPFFATTLAGSNLLHEYLSRSDIASAGFKCPTQMPGQLETIDRPFSADELYDAIRNQPGVMGFKAPTGAVDADGNVIWSMQWQPKDTHYKAITLNWALDKVTDYVYWRGGFSTVVSFCLCSWLRDILTEIDFYGPLDREQRLLSQ